MRVIGAVAVTALAGFVLAGCTPEFAKENQTGFIMEIAGFDPSPLLSDVADDEGRVINDDVTVEVNVLRKNNNPDLGVSPIEHVYLDSYEVRFFRTDGRNVEGVDVPYRITGPLGNVRFHTPGPGGAGEVQIGVPITLVRHQAKFESPLRNLMGNAGAIVITTVAEVTIYGHQLNGGQGLKATGRLQVTFADFPG